MAYVAGHSLRARQSLLGYEVCGLFKTFSQLSWGRAQLECGVWTAKTILFASYLLKDRLHPWNESWMRWMSSTANCAFYGELPYQGHMIYIFI